MFRCEICNWQTSDEKEFYNHLSRHSKEEVRKLRKLAKMAIENPELYEKFMLEMAKIESND